MKKSANLARLFPSLASNLALAFQPNSPFRNSNAS
jgi:hypothetical protein